jgi:hypothetical protein
MAGGRRLPPSMERLWLGELRRAHAIINIITLYLHVISPPAAPCCTGFYVVDRSRFVEAALTPAAACSSAGRRYFGGLRQGADPVRLRPGRVFILFRSKCSGSASARVTLLNAGFWKRKFIYSRTITKRRVSTGQAPIEQSAGPVRIITGLSAWGMPNARARQSVRSSSK